MRSLATIMSDISDIKQEIKYSREQEAPDRYMEELYTALEELEDERNEVRAMELGLGNVSYLQV